MVVAKGRVIRWRSRLTKSFPHHPTSIVCHFRATISQVRIANPPIETFPLKNYYLIPLGHLGHPLYPRLRKTTPTETMGIKQLFSIIKEEAPEAVKEGEIKNQFGRKVAIVSVQKHVILIRLVASY